MIKKAISLLSVLVVLGLASKEAQAQASFRYGIKAGVNISNLYDSDADISAPDSRTGFMSGLYLNYLFPNIPFSVQAEALYSQKGFTASGLTHDVDYIDVPLFMNYHFLSARNYIPHIYAGPYVGFKINAEREISEVSPTSEPDNFTDSVRDNSFGFIVGAGVDMGALNFSIRYTIGLTDLFEEQNGKISVFSVTAGYGF